MVYIFFNSELLSLEGLSFSVMIKEEVQCRGKDLKIIGCYDSEIFIESSVRSVYIVGCSNSNIYVEELANLKSPKHTRSWINVGDGGRRGQGRAYVDMICQSTVLFKWRYDI